MHERVVAEHVAGDLGGGYQIDDGKFFDRIFLVGPGVREPINLYELTRPARESGIAAQCSFSDGVTVSIAPRHPRAALLSFTAPEGIAVPQPFVCNSWSIRKDGERHRVLGFDFVIQDEVTFAKEAELVRLGFGVHRALREIEEKARLREPGDTANTPIPAMTLTKRAAEGDVLSLGERPIFINFAKFAQNDFVHFLDTSSECLEMLGRLVRASAPQRFSIDLDMATLRAAGIEKECKLSALTRPSRMNEVHSSLPLAHGVQLFVTPYEFGSACVSFCVDDSDLCRYEVPEPVVCGIVPVAEGSGVTLDFDRCVARPAAGLPTKERLVDLARQLDAAIHILNEDARRRGVKEFDTVTTPVDSLRLCVGAAAALYKDDELVYETGGRKTIFRNLSEPCLESLRELVTAMKRTHQTVN